jgi:hypothetical protein
MPHVVSKLTSVGSMGDLARITAKVEELGLNIIAIGGGEGITGNGEVGVVAMLLDHDEDIDNVAETLRNLPLDDNRRLADVELAEHVHIIVLDHPGALAAVASALAGINIRTLISMGSIIGRTHVSLGFRQADEANAREALANVEGVIVVPKEEELAAG